MKNPLLATLGLSDFRPLAGLSSGFLQTVAGSYWPQRPDSGRAELIRVELGSDDATLVALERPDGWESGGRIALLLHGLAGDHLSSYMVRIGRKLLAEGYLVVRMNLRNSGPAFGLSRKTYHAGITPDARAVLQWIAGRFPDSPVTAIGFSLGGNLLLKLGSEDGAQPTRPLERIVAVSPAVDLASASRKLDERPGSIIAQVFLHRLLDDMERLRELYPVELGAFEIPRRRMTIREFDDLHIPYMHEFRDAADYYERCSSLPHLARIEAPTLIIGSKDDPVVDLTGLEYATLGARTDLVLTEQGGHVGYLGFGNSKWEPRWSDDLILGWLKLTDERSRG